ncbi:MAG: adenine deaminase [Sphaerochaetaceae bacterium]
MINSKQIKKLIKVASGRIEADLVIRNGKVVDIFNKRIVSGDIAIVDGVIAGIGNYEAKEIYDAKGAYVSSGFIDAHVHIESSLVDPASFSKLLVPHGTTTAIVDPHEICNVAGLDGFDYMLENSANLPLSIFVMFPSCVPSTVFEHAGAILDASKVAQRIDRDRVLGLGEMMDMVGTIEAQDHIVDKLLVAHNANKMIDGHGPMLKDLELNAFAAAGIKTDHECTTAEELTDRLQRGMYVMLREGSATQDLRKLLPAVTKENSRYCLFCTDDRQPFSILEEGHIDNHLRIAVQEGLDPLEALRMATINAAECYSLNDRGAIAPGRRADLVILEDLKNFKVLKVFTGGKEYKEESLSKEAPISKSVLSKVNIGSYSADKLKLKLNSTDVKVIGIQKGSLITTKERATVKVDKDGYYENDPDVDIVKLAVLERHRATGNVGLALLRGLNLNNGAVATTIAHDSHNVIVAGDNDVDIDVAIKELKRLGGGLLIVQNGKVLEALELPIGGLMTNKGGLYVKDKLEALHKVAIEKLGMDSDGDPFTTLSFMALPVIPSLKVTDMGLFDVEKNEFVSIEN